MLQLSNSFHNLLDLMDASVFLDIENCHIPRNVTIAEIKSELNNLSNKINIEIKTITVVGNSHTFRAGLEQELAEQGIIYHCTSKKKNNIADMKILHKLIQLTSMHPPPYTIILISGDSDFRPFIEHYKLLGYYIILIYSGTATPELIKCANMSIPWHEITHVTESPKLTFLNALSSSSLSDSDFDYDPKYNACVVKFYSTKLSQIYTISNNINIRKGNIVKVTNFNKSWTIGKVIKLLKIGNIDNHDKSSILEVIQLDKLQLDNKLSKDIKLLNICNQHVKLLLNNQIKILTAEICWDGLQIAIRYTSSENSIISVKSFVDALNRIYHLNINMIYIQPCRYQQTCYKTHCNFYHT